MSSEMKLRPTTVTTLGRAARVWTYGEGPPVVLVHGGIGDAPQHWEKLAARIGDRYRVFAPALPSYEGSDPLESPSWGSLVEWLGGIFDALGLEKAPLAGNSFGAATSRAFTSRFPERVSRLVLINGGILPPIPAWVGKVLSSAIFTPVHSLVGAGMYSRRGLRTMIATESIMTDEFVENARVQGKHFTKLVMGVGSSGPPDFRRFDVPTTVLWGDADPAFPVKMANELCAAIPGATVKLVRGAGHMPQNEAPDAFAEAFSGVIGAG